MKHIYIKFCSGLEVNEPFGDQIDRLKDKLVIKIPERVKSTHWTNAFIAAVGKIAGANDAPALVDEVMVFDGPEIEFAMSTEADEYIRFKPILGRIILQKEVIR